MGNRLVLSRSALDDSSLRIGNLELLKWIGFAAMLVDHVGAYALETVWWSEAVGALALPLFALAFGAGLAKRPTRCGWVVLRRLVVWSFFAQVAVALVRDGFTLTALSTIALGLLLWLSLAEGERWIDRAVACVFVAIAACFVEFAHVGVAVVACACWFARRGTAAAGTCLLLSCAALMPFNGSHAALLAIPLAMLVAALPRDLPRLRGVFYWGYVGQFPLLRVLRELVS